MGVTAAQVKELRQATGVGMMECKKALVENNGDMDQAIRWLRERGMARAAKKAGRTAAEGIVAVKVAADGLSGSLVEVNCETDFASKNEHFQEFVAKVTDLVLARGLKSVSELAALPIAGADSVEKALAQLIATVGENMSLRRVETLKVASGRVCGYSHMGGKIGTLVAVDGPAGPELTTLGHDIAMHIAASAPKYLDRSAVPPEEVEREQEIARSRMREQGKPDAIIDKALGGQTQKYFGDVCLVDQPFVKEPKLTVAKVASQVGATVSGFRRYQLGEGIEVKQENFADEVAAQLQK